MSAARAASVPAARAARVRQGLPRAPSSKRPLRWATLVVLVCAVAACSDWRDDRLPRDAWRLPLDRPEMARMSKEDRIAFSIFQRHAMRLDPGAQSPPEGTTWRQAIASGKALRKKQDAAVALVRAQIGEANAPVASVIVGAADAVCGRLSGPTGGGSTNPRQFVVFANGEVHVAPRAAEYTTDEPRATARYAEVLKLHDACASVGAVATARAAPPAPPATGTGSAPSK
jgi:hypothetical protein